VMFIFFVLNLMVLVYDYLNPEGFWGISYFVEFIRAGIVFFLLFITWIIGLIGYFPSRKKSNSVLRFFLVLIVLPVILSFNFFLESGIPLLFSKKMNDRYRYINQSEEYLEDGHYDQAFDFGLKLYMKLKNKEPRPSFFFLSNWYTASDKYQERRISTLYDATINYAFVMEQTSNKDPRIESIYKEALRLLSKKKNINETQLILPYLGLARYNLNNQSYAKADFYYQELTNINEYQNSDVSRIIMMNLAFTDYQLYLGNQKKAAEYTFRSLKLFEDKYPDSESRIYLELLLSTHLGALSIGEFEEAGKLIAKAQALAENRSDEPNYHAFLSIKGYYCELAALKEVRVDELLYDGSFVWLNSAMEEETDIRTLMLNKANECYSKSLEIISQEYGVNHPIYRESMVRNGYFLNRWGKYEEARKVLGEVLSHGDMQHDINDELKQGAKIQYYLACSELGDLDSVKSNIQSIEQEMFARLDTSLIILSEQERESYVYYINKRITLINSIYAHCSDSLCSGELYDNILATKNIALNTSNQIRGLKSDLNNDSLFEKTNNLRKSLSRISDQDKHAIKVAEYSIRKMQKELQNLAVSSGKSEIIRSRKHTWRDLQSVLNEGECAIEIISIPSSYPEIDNEYYALCIEPGLDQPKKVFLFKETTLYSMYQKSGSDRQKVEHLYFGPSAKLKELIHEKMDTLFHGKQKTYISVSGVFHNLSLSALFDNVNYVQLGSTLSVIDDVDCALTGSKASLFGGLNYDGQLNYSGEPFSRSGNLFNVIDLPGTKNEIVGIQDLIEVTGGEVCVYTEDDGTEENFRKLDGMSMDIIHLATHGYIGKEYKVDLMGDTPFSNFDYPMARSGLLFSGVNSTEISSYDNDGILSARDVSSMNLSSTQLIVFSACETGLGENKGQEGVYGFYRASKLAGVDWVMTSLWQVPDQQTAQLMNLFYESLLSGESPSQALHSAQHEIKKHYPSPYFWSGFNVIY
jgi:CHAT domain-containing protein